MDGAGVGVVLALLAAPVVIGVLVGAVYSVRFRGELDEARALARQMYYELDEARYELERVQEALEHAEGDPPTTELPALRPVPRLAAGRHRLREQSGG